jgi:hypothetical protein
MPISPEREQAIIIAATLKTAIEMQTAVMASMKISGKVQQTVNFKEQFKTTYLLLFGALAEIEREQ